MNHVIAAPSLPKVETKRSTWRVPVGLLLLSLVPVLAGVVRVHEMGTTRTITPDNARFLAAPVSALLHIVCATLYLVLGAFQVTPGVLRRAPRWHRLTGRALVPLGVIAALSGLWMTAFYPPVDHDGLALFGIRVVVGSAWVLFMALGVTAVMRRNFVAHGAWMLRGYAIGMGAGTQVLTHLPWLAFPDLQNELTRVMSMGGGWVINLLIAEWVIRRQRASRSR